MLGVIVKAWMSNLVRWLRALLVWLGEKRHAWFALAVSAVALLVSLRPGTAEPLIRYVGLMLQLLGICTVVWGISETRALFGHPTLVSAVKAWVRKFPPYHPTTIGAAGGLVSGSATMTGRGYGTFGAGPNPTLEARVEATEKNIAAINNRMDQTITEMDARHQQHVAAIRRESDARVSADATLHQKLEATGTGGVHISLMGALWLFVGSVLATAAPEIALLLR